MNDQWRTDTAERPRVVVSPESTQPPSPAGPPPAYPAPQTRERAPLPGWIAWVIVALALVVVAVVGVQLVLQPPGTSTASDPAASADDEAPAEEDEAPAEETSEKPAEEEPSDEEPADETPPEWVALGGLAEVSVPAAAPPNNDVTGERVTFDGPNMLDGQTGTAWRMAGDASGETITFTFSQPVTITAIGLLNGYAKTSVDSAGREFNWYAGNRRILSVEWVVGDVVVATDFIETTELQAFNIEPTSTTTVELRIVAVSPPGAGSTGRDYTAISEVGFSGYPS